MPIKSPPLRIVCIRFRPLHIVSLSRLPHQNHMQPLPPLPPLLPLLPLKPLTLRQRQRQRLPPLFLLPQRSSSIPLLTRTPVSVQFLPDVLSRCLTLHFVSIPQPPIALQTPRSSGPAPTMTQTTWTACRRCNAWTMRTMKSTSLGNLMACREQLVHPHISFTFFCRVPMFFLLPLCCSSSFRLTIRPDFPYVLCIHPVILVPVNS